MSATATATATMTQPRLPPTSTRELTGTIRALVWTNWREPEVTEDPSQGMAIARLSQGQTVKGPCQPHTLEIGLAYRFLGRPTSHHQYGEQFVFSTFTKSEPATQSGVIRYLVKLYPNVGERKAAQLWAAFGPEAVQTLRERPELVADAGILSQEQAAEAAAELAKFASLEQTKIELFGIFDGRGFPGKLLEQCIGRWGANAAHRVRVNPFSLMTAKPKLAGAGFKRCDKLWRDYGFSPTRLKRLMLAGWYTLREDSNGHTWLPRGATAEAIRNSMGLAAFCNGVSGPDAAASRAITLGVRSQWLAVRDAAGGPVTDQAAGAWVAEAGKARNEQLLADKVHELSLASPLWADASTDVAAGVLSDHQRKTLATSLRSAVGILAGTPGTGKTFTAAQVVKYLACRFGLGRIAVAAPTGKAAVRCTAAMLSYAINLEATTIHRLLKIGRNGHDGDGWGFTQCASNPLPFQFLIIDESSMLDTDLAAALFSACAPGTHVLLIGDPYQLPPVGHGAPLRDLIAAGIPCGELSEIRRNSGLIVAACSRIKDGKEFETATAFDPATGQNLRHIEAETPEQQLDVLKAILQRFTESGKFQPIWDCQVLVAVNDKSPLGRRPVNAVLQDALNPGGQRVAGNAFRVDDKIICVKNSSIPLAKLRLGSKGHDPSDYQPQGIAEFVANGELGKVLAVGPGAIVAQFDAPRRVFKIAVKAGRRRSEDADDTPNGEDGDDGTGSGDKAASKGAGCDFDLAYVITTHKSQGSEWPVAIVLIDDYPGAKRVCSREHIYTAISRGKQLVVTIGKRATLTGLARRVSLERRKTFLKELLAERISGKQ